MPSSHDTRSASSPGSTLTLTGFAGAFRSSVSAPIADAVGVAVWPEGKKWTQTLIVRVWLSAQV